MVCGLTKSFAQDGDIEVSATLQGRTSISENQSLDFGLLLGGTTKEIDPATETVTSSNGVVGGETRGVYFIVFDPNPGSAIIEISVDTMLTSSGETLPISYIDSNNSNEPYIYLTASQTGSSNNFGNVTSLIIDGTKNAAFDNSTTSDIGKFSGPTIQGDQHVFETSGYITDEDPYPNISESYHLFIGGKVFVDNNQTVGTYRGNIVIKTTYTETDQQ
mgnify:FL=1